jgi:hypothetical protein
MRLRRTVALGLLPLATASVLAVSAPAMAATGGVRPALPVPCIQIGTQYCCWSTTYSRYIC